ncbi:hypothetical protein AQI88_33205 [Streptomyces cellostaticus]|uniref:Lipoprotein CseA n=1 Tax=Streptomyces cellostaticus TaxID=67285 RepID=A0A117PUG9_9ACTN|nr:hypothetical protein AQI88_33205 [Streptomyces cellostaticus]
MIAAAASIAALALFLAACGSGGTGARDEGPAHASAVAGAVVSPTSSPSEAYRSVDAVALLKDDPAVSAAVKRDLKPCEGDDYAVDVSYGDLTGGSVDDVLINVLTCADKIGLATYVYRDEGGTFKNVFKNEESPVVADIEQRTLSVTKQVYKKDDPISSPSSEDVITYVWKAGRFVQQGRPVHNDYGSGGDAMPVPDN